jgi:methionyl-tRNA synthetase
VVSFGAADVFARYHRMRGSDVLMVSGTDDHGTPITFGADQEGIPPRQFADRNNAIIIEDLRRLGLSYDLFTRTVTRNHYRVVQDLFRKLVDKGYIVPRTTMGAFSPSTGRTLPDRYIEGTCPICGYPEARGDQCDNCGNQLDPTDLINPRSRINGEVPEFRETEHFFLELPKFADALADWIQTKKEIWRPSVYNFSINQLPELKARAITRDLDWGVPVPGWEDQPLKRIYVWFDAVIGYLSASIEWAGERGEPDAWRRWWDMERDVPHFYFMGKDNITFHTLIWPSILMGDGGLQLPYDIAASQHLTMGGKQLSVSRGHVIEVRDFLSRYDPDPLRYYLSITGPENQDTDFTWAEFVRRNNDELVGTWGNLVHRTLVNAYRNFGAVPSPGQLNPTDQGMIADSEAAIEEVGQHLGRARFQAAIKHAMATASKVNVYIQGAEPWKVIKSDRERAATVLYVGLRCVDNLKIALTPFLPFTSQRLHEMLGYDGVIAPMPEAREYGEGEDRHAVLAAEYPRQITWRPSELEPGQQLREPQQLFKKLDDSVVDEELKRMGGGD